MRDERVYTYNEQRFTEVKNENGTIIRDWELIYKSDAYPTRDSALSDVPCWVEDSLHELLSSKHPSVKRSHGAGTPAEGSASGEVDHVEIRGGKSPDTAAVSSSEKPRDHDKQSTYSTADTDVPKVNAHGKRSASEISPVHGRDKRVRFEDEMEVTTSALDNGKGGASEFQHLLPNQVMERTQEQQQTSQANTSGLLSVQSDTWVQEALIELGEESAALGFNKENVVSTPGDGGVATAGMPSDEQRKKPNGKLGWSWN